MVDLEDTLDEWREYIDDLPDGAAFEGAHPEDSIIGWAHRELRSRGYIINTRDATAGEDKEDSEVALIRIKPKAESGPISYASTLLACFLKAIKATEPTEPTQLEERKENQNIT